MLDIKWIRENPAAFDATMEKLSYMGGVKKLETFTKF